VFIQVLLSPFLLGQTPVDVGHFLLLRESLLEEEMVLVAALLPYS